MANWLVASFMPCAPFSLRTSLATTSGAHSYLAPTPYSVKMALIDAGFRVHNDGCPIFTAVAQAEIRVKPAPAAAVTHTFTKVLRAARSDSDSDEPFVTTIAYREFVWMGGPFQVAVKVTNLSAEQRRMLEEVFPCINYFGKRGSFCQFAALEYREELDHLFGYVLGNDSAGSAPSLIVQYQDDFTADTQFANINTHDIAAGKRTFRLVGLPYRQTASSRHYTLYVRTDRSV